MGLQQKFCSVYSLTWIHDTRDMACLSSFGKLSRSCRMAEANAVGPNEPSKLEFPSFIRGYHAYMGTVGAYCR